jgi:MYXO-CTERM domain-containing protein
MKTVFAALCASALLGTTAQAGVAVGVDDSSAAWLGFMNVFELDGMTPAFSSGWGVADLNVAFDDGSGTMTFSPNTIGDPDPYWYQGGGAPGNPGNKVMEANLYQQSDDGSLSGTTVTFAGNVSAFSLTSAHEATVFIRDFAADFSSFTETTADIDATGAFSISHDTDADITRHVQWGVQMKGVNVWFTDVAPFGSVVFDTVPTPGAFALLGMGGLVASRRRRS